MQWVVARRLFSKEPFLDFARSDPAARSFLLRSGFDLLETAVCRGIPVSTVPMCIKACAVTQYLSTLNIMSRLSRDHASLQQMG